VNENSGFNLGSYIGQMTGSVDFVVTSEDVKDYVASTDMEPDTANALSLFTVNTIAPPDLVAKIAMRDLYMLFLMKEFGPSIRTKQGYHFFGPIFIGARIRSAGYISNIYCKRGKTFIELKANFLDEEGKCVLSDYREVMLVEGAEKYGIPTQ